MGDGLASSHRRSYLPRWVSLVLLILLVTGIAPSPLGAKPQHSAETTVTVTPQGATASTSVTAGTGAAHHPSRVLVRFQRGVRNYRSKTV